MLQVSEPYYNESGKEVIRLTYTDGHTEEADFLRKGRDY